MSAADRMVVRTPDGAYKSVPRRQGLGMIAAGRAVRASAAPVEPAPGDSGDLAELLAVASTPAPAPEPEQPAEEVPEPELPDGESDDYDDWPDAEPEQAAELPAEPRGNASRQEWATYAVSLGVEVTDDMTRNKIRDAAQDAAQSLDRLPQPALPGGRLETPEDEPAAERLADDEDPGTR